MKARLPLFVILGGSLAFLASLFLNWTSTPVSSRHLGPLSIINLYNAFEWNGWASPFGQAAAIAAIALALSALVSISRPALEAALPIGGCAVALLTLTLVNAAALQVFSGTSGGLPVHVGAGAYLGGAAALVAFLVSAWVSHDDVPERGAAVAAALLTIGLVSAFALFVGNTRAYATTGSAMMLLIASVGLTFWFGTRQPLKRLSAAAVVLVLVVGSFSVFGTRTHWPYESWLALGCAVGLLVLAAATNREHTLAGLGRTGTIALIGAALLLASLFFHWQTWCASSGLKGSTCLVANGWGGGLIGGLAGIFVVLLLGFRYLSPELAVTIAIYVIGEGLAYTARGSLGYGAFIGFVGAALVLVAVGLQPRKSVRGGFRLVPIAASLAFLAIPVAALSDRLSMDIEFYGSWRLVLLEAAAIVVGVRLIGRWLTGPAADIELLYLPVVLVALTGLDLGERVQADSIGWEGLLALAMSVLLLVLGWFGQRGGLDNFRIPDEIWRVDRISTGEN